jgi:hypothetical protein
MTSKRPLSSMECLHSWSCTCTDSLTCCVTDEMLCQLPRLLVSFERALGMDGMPATEFVCFSFDFYVSANSHLPLSAPLCMRRGVHFVSRILYRRHWRTTKTCGPSSELHLHLRVLTSEPPSPCSFAHLILSAQDGNLLMGLYISAVFFGPS